MAKNPKWTAEEDNILINNYPIMGISGCINLLSRTEKAINVRASRLGLKMLNAWNKKCTNESYSNKLNNINNSVILDDEYINDSTEIYHICTICNNRWKVKPNNLLNGSGCPKCTKGFGWLDTLAPNKYSKLYLIELELTNGDIIFKVGITNNTIKRYSAIRKGLGSLFKNMIVRAELNMKAKIIIEVEKIIHKELQDYKYISPIIFGGHTELFKIEGIDYAHNLIFDILEEGVFDDV